MAYFGVTFASTSLAGDPYLNFALVIFIELLHVPFEGRNTFNEKVQKYSSVRGCMKLVLVTREMGDSCNLLLRDIYNTTWIVREIG